jgi:hypothetical protein
MPLTRQIEPFAAPLNAPNSHVVRDFARAVLAYDNLASQRQDAIAQSNPIAGDMLFAKELVCAHKLTS